MSWNDLFVNMDNTNFFNFSFLPKYGSAFVRGFEYTLLLAVVSVLLAVIPALLLALMRLSKIKPVKWLSGAYIAVFRSTPMLVQLSIIYFGLFYAISLPRLTLFGFVDISRFIPGVVALALNSSAYVAEIFRAGILAVDKGQAEAARSLGLSNWDKPAAACLASRIPYGTTVTRDLLARVEAAEEFLRSLGFKELRVRHHGEIARIEVPPSAFSSASERRTGICGGLHALGWAYITLDLDGLRQGSMNEVLSGRKDAS